MQSILSVNVIASAQLSVQAAQRLVLAAAAGLARDLCLPKPLQARDAYPEAAKPLSAANDVSRHFIVAIPATYKPLMFFLNSLM
jgi:hypothetical protein